MATKQDLNEKLDFLGLDLEDIPKFLTEVGPINFNPSRLNNDKELKVYRYISINDIDIYCTPAYRDDPVREKCEKAMSLGEYLKKPESGEDFERQKDFIRMLEDFSIEEFYEINDRQNEMNTGVPFKVFYPRNQLWQIYYSEKTGRYFMLVSTKEDTYSEFFYLLKKQIELNTSRGRKKDEEIYVPISYVNYNEQLLSNKHINDIENYLWVFNKNWPLVYEVYDKKGNMSLQIVGETYVYENLKTTYKVVLDSKESAESFYKLVKALFILQTELSNRYVFRTQIDNMSSLEFTYDDKVISFEGLAKFVKEKYEETEEDIKRLSNDVYEAEKRLEILKEEVKEKEAEYFKKQKEISTYLEYKKTFFGKVKYFFKGGKKKKTEKEQEEENKKELQKLKDDFKKNKEERNKRQEETELEEAKNKDRVSKKYYTIDDLVSINKIFEKSNRNVNDLRQDIKALELKLLNVTKKTENATLYIKEIDKHKKSIFDFWKFANKDEVLELEVGTEEQLIDKDKFKKKFEFETDFEELGVNADKNQRIKLSKSELDNIFVATDQEVLPILNMLKAGDMDKDVIEDVFMNLKKEYSKTALQGNEEGFDVLGTTKDDITQVKYIGNKSHRESEKDKYQILSVNKKIDVFDFTEKLQMIVHSLNESFAKIRSIYDTSIYRIIPINDKVHESGFEFYNLDIERELEQYDHKEESAIKLIRLNFKEEMPLVYMTNIVFFDNANNTLPQGMNMSTKVLVDCDKLEFTLANKTKFKTNKYFSELTGTESPKIVYIYFEEYDIELKTNQKQKKEKKEEKENIEEENA